MPRTARLSLTALAAALALAAPVARGQDQQTTPPAKKQAAEVILPMGVVTPDAWTNAPTGPIRPGEIDRVINAALAEAGLEPAPRVGDAEFVRRAYLDLTGRLPVPADVTEFLDDRDPDKRAKLIDRLLAGDAYAAHWARYWREVVTASVTDRQVLALANTYEAWMKDQLRQNVPWDETVRAMLTAQGEMRFDKPGENGAAFFLLSRRGADAPTERAAETSRLFLGVQIQCAQCHDHPFDDWKRVQFHEFTAYLARTRERPVREEQRIVGVSLVSIPFGEHRMEDTANPKKSTTVYPKFLDGRKPRGRFLTDQVRRQSLADAVTADDNPYFAAAFVNRVWGELLGQSFYKPVDDLGPQREAVLPELIARLAASFRGSGHDVKELFRVVMNTEAYQRQIRLGVSTDQHLLFAARYPARMQANALWQSLEGVLGTMGFAGGPFGRGGFGGAFGPGFGLKEQFLNEFQFDPSAKPEDVEGTLSQALLLMNNPSVQQKIDARGTNLLARVLDSYPDDRKALDLLYLRTLARRPTERELARCLDYLRGAPSRASGYEDILWALLNSTEFQTER